ISCETTYGLYLSDHNIVDWIMAQDLLWKAEGHLLTHLRAVRRIGSSMEDYDLLIRWVELVADSAGVKLGLMPRVKGHEHEV
ncbi:uncharacterized protein BDR25DRAFT_238004, partial [Lindgomyces ingoldianus]